MKRKIHHRVIPALIITSVFLLDASVVPASEGSPPSLRFTVDGVMEHIRILASDSLAGRGAGTDNARRAAAYIRDRFEELELVPAGDEGGYFQTFTFTKGTAAGENNSLTMVDGSVRTVAELEMDFLPMSSSANGSARGNVVFAGYGLSVPERGHDDYRGLDVDGSIVVVLDGVPPSLEGSEVATGRFLARKKAQLAREAGAAGLILIQSNDPALTMKYDGNPSDVGIPFVEVSRSFGTDLLARAGIRFDSRDSSGHAAAAPQQLPALTVEIETEIEKIEATGRNVLAILQGHDEKRSREHIVIGAHYDHLGQVSGEDGTVTIYNGADDNASGVAGILEIAERLADSGTRRSILFASFDAEEVGALGSLHLTRNAPVPLESIAAMINLDMIGRMQEKTLIVSGYDTSPQWDEMLDMSASGLGLDVKKSGGGFGGSDHTSFYKDDIPILFFFTGAHDDYNTPDDDWDRINAAGEVLVLEHVLRTVERIDMLDEPPEFQRSAARTERPGRSQLPVSVGTVPDFTHEGKGYAIIGTKPGSPAETAGLLKGDVITSIDDREVGSIYDFMGILSQHRPGDVVLVTVQRGEDTVSLEVTLGGKD
jgi:hypothetical protein